MEFREIVLKVTSVCNLNCSYCYVFNKGDKSYMTEPNMMNDQITNILLERIENYCNKNKIKRFLIIFHGGEPLLLKKTFYVNFKEKANEIIKSTTLTLAMQTNGTLLTDDWCELLQKLDIQVGVSLDGTEKASINRVFKKSKDPAYHKIIKGFETLQKYQPQASILSVININELPQDSYSLYKNLNIFLLDLLFPDTTYHIKDDAVGKVGKWLSEMFDIWYFDSDKNKPIIRLFDIILNIILGDQRGNEVLGSNHNCAITVKTNGQIEPVDSLKICGDGYTKTNFNILENELDDVENHQLMKLYYNAHQDDVLCNECKKCIIKNICGGGQLAHRFSSKNHFDNPSVYCND
ncbi:XyeB family radical SAM/SPASM peptide maturase [Bacteroidia bacterium]|nr:XyeB family radical SAM/SPASM peptide maturase [Bacteroidia bacterium]